MFKRLFSFMVVVLIFTTMINAQVTTAGINGKVVAEGEPAIGATVLAIHEPSGTRYGTITNADGHFSLQGMRSGGPYKVEITYIGFQKSSFSGITLQLGENYLLDAALKASSEILNEVVVVASRDGKFNSQKTGAAVNFSRNKIENSPSISRSIYDVAKMTPQATVSGSGLSFAGSNNRYNSFQIDGAVNNDVFGLSSSGTNGGQTGANPISLDAIEEIQVVIAPFDVRQSGFTGGGINAITKSGTNDFHGSAYEYYNNQNFAGTTAGKDVTDREEIIQAIG
jgi:TonB-dependent Receptor Plug Domain.